MAISCDRIYELLSLEIGWDGYRAHKIDPKDVEATQFLLSLLPPEWRDSAQIVPTTEGGVMVEWHREGRDIELHVYDGSF